MLTFIQGNKYLLAVLAAIVVIVLIIVSFHNEAAERMRHEESQREQGRYEERVNTTEEIINDLRKATTADTVRDATRDNRLCNKYSRTPESCQ